MVRVVVKVMVMAMARVRVRVRCRVTGSQGHRVTGSQGHRVTGSGFGCQGQSQKEGSTCTGIGSQCSVPHSIAFAFECIHHGLHG